MAVQKFMPDEDWRVIKAMCYQESLFDHMAVSSSGARGVCQLMPDTFKFISKRTGMYGVDIFVPKDNIYAGVAYLAWLRGQFTSKRTRWELIELYLASYNSGLGNVLKAQKLCGNSLVWQVIKNCMINVTGKNNSRETINYVSKIKKWYSELEKCQPSDIQSLGLRSFNQLSFKLHTVYNSIENWLEQSQFKSLPSVQHFKQGFVRFGNNSIKFMYGHDGSKRSSNESCSSGIWIKITNGTTANRKI